ncbi:hypothetical protein AB0A91_09070 [Streptomyces sp. NPDC042207]|uniref:hypothetical protein n=1 Tax=Streptomyces sp. NPDC042207 TaxID=3154331 RepID=UPI0033FFE1E1
MGSVVWASLGSAGAGAPQETRWSCSPNPDCRLRSAPHADAGSGPPPRGAATGSSSKKCGPVSSTAKAAAEPAPGGGPSGSPSAGAGRLVPGTQAAPFQYRT